jgi:thymidylate synthase ThyX
MQHKKDNSSFRDDTIRSVKFINHLESIKATIYQCPTMEDLEKFIPEFVSITWLQEIDQVDEFLKSRGMTRKDAVMEMFNWRTLPTAWETIRVTFLLEGLDLTNVTHTIRHRLFSFSAQSTDPVSMSSHPILENEAFLKDPELLEKSRKLCDDANELYDLALEKGVSYYDARHYMPRAKEAKYFMSGSLKDFIMFVKTRMGVQNQPISDNVLALRVRQAILERFPFLEKQMPTKPIEHHYVNAITEKFNLNTWPPSSTHQKILDEKGIDISNIEFDHHARKEDLVENQVGELIKQAIINNEI